jgi:hypothetical protein
VATKTIYVALNAGANTISIGNSSGYAPDIDKIVIHVATGTSTRPAVAMEHMSSEVTGEKIFTVAGSKFIVPDYYAGTHSRLCIYNSMGKLLNTVIMRSRTIDLIPLCGASYGIHIVRIKYVE